MESSMKKIFAFIIIVFLSFNTICIAKDDIEIDENNERGTSYWTNIPIVSQELLDKDEITTGGEGGQWPLCMAISSDEKYLFYGTDVGGIYRSTDKGKTWDKSMKNFTAAGISDIMVDPNNSERIIVFGTNSDPQYTTGIHLSVDGGETWSFQQNFMVGAHREVLDNLDFDSSSYNKDLGYTTIAYVSLVYEKDYLSKNFLEKTNVISDDYTDGKSQCKKAGLYKTEDGGYTWNMVNNEMYDGIVKVNPITGTVYIAREDGLFQSYNQGKTFVKIISEEVTSLEIVKSNNIAKIYYTTQDGVFYKENDRDAFTKIKSDNFPVKEKMYPQSFNVSPVNNNNMIMFVGEEMEKDNKYNIKGNIYYSSDAGKTWNISKYDESYNFLYYYMERVPNFIWSTTQENKIWTFQNDWVSSSSNGGETFRWDSNGICGILIGGKWHFNIYNSDIIYLGSQDYNGVVTLDGGKTWKRIDLYTYDNEYGRSNWPNNGFIYGGYAADELTYFGGAAKSWYDTRYLTITHDGGKTHTCYIGYKEYALSGGKNNRLQDQATTSSYQSAKNPKILFCGDLRSTDGGYNWERMVNENGNVEVTGVYTHDPKTGRLFGINDYIGWVMYSDDDGETWQRYNKESLNKYDEAPYLEELSYDSKNDKLYVAWGWAQLSVIEDNGNKVTEISNTIPQMLQFEGAPTREQIGSRYCARRIRTVSVDPNNPDIIYVGGSCYTYRGDSSIYRSCDGGKTWKVVSINASNSIVSTENGDYGGVEPVCINVKPDTGDLWSTGSCTGLSKLTPPYISKTEDILIGDIDQNGEIAINDLAKLKLHLIGKKLLVDSKSLNLADIDRDGKVTINDLAGLKLMLIG